MTSRIASRRAARRTRSVLALLAVLGGLVLGGLRHPPVTPSSSITALPAEHRPSGRPDRTGQGVLGLADGLVPDGTTVFATVPAVARLDPALLASLRRAAKDGAEDHVAFDVNSGWRSPAYQEHLLDEAISKYGSREQAEHWVATPARSAHVSGDAVDLGHDAAEWLSDHGGRYGLCQVYANEPWHYELRPSAVDHGCPARYADPTHDPRMSR
jgi:hypothetical protein